MQTNETQPAPGELKGQIVQNDLEYADDTQLLIEMDARGQICERMLNYEVITESRALKIQWAKVLLPKQTGKRKMWMFPPLFDQIKQGNAGTIQGKEFSMAENLRKAAGSRIAKAQNTCGHVRRGIFRNKLIITLVKITPWNSMIRSTIAYGMHAKKLPRNLLHRLETYMYKHIRTMMSPRWREEAWCPKTDLQEDQTVSDGILAEQAAD